MLLYTEETQITQLDPTDTIVHFLLLQKHAKVSKFLLNLARDLLVFGLINPLPGVYESNWKTGLGGEGVYEVFSHIGSWTWEGQMA